MRSSSSPFCRYYFSMKFHHENTKVRKVEKDHSMGFFVISFFRVFVMNLPAECFVKSPRVSNATRTAMVAAPSHLAVGVARWTERAGRVQLIA